MRSGAATSTDGGLDLAEYLKRQGSSREQIVRVAEEALTPAADDLLLFCGSLAEGIGNVRSDVDLLLITRRDEREFAPAEMLLVDGTIIIDVRVARRNVVESLIDRVTEWAAQPRRERLALAFSEDERKLLHRIRVGLPARGDPADLQNRIDGHALARLKLDVARYATRTIQVDLAGLRAAGDTHSLLFAAQELARHTFDALLAAHGDTNPSWKWRVRRLGQLPADWDAAIPGRRAGMPALDLYVDLHRIPPSGAAATLAQARRIAAFSRRVLGWAEQRLLQRDTAPLQSVPADAADDGDALPHLDLDVAVRYDAGRFQLMRLAGSGQIFELTPNEYELVCLFDGRRAPHSFRALRRLRALIRGGDLEAREMVDEAALRALLREHT